MKKKKTQTEDKNNCSLYLFETKKNFFFTFMISALPIVVMLVSRERLLCVKTAVSLVFVQTGG
jgi:hypothetical protein